MTVRREQKSALQDLSNVTTRDLRTLLAFAEIDPVELQSKQVAKEWRAKLKKASSFYWAKKIGLPSVPKFRFGEATGGQFEKAHRGLRQCLADLFPQDEQQYRYWSSPAFSSRLSLGVNDYGRIRHHQIPNDNKWLDGFWIAMVLLLQQHGHEVRRCDREGCDRLFVKVKRAQYCSPQCSQRVRSARWYADHQDAAQETRREAYAAGVRRKQPRAKIGGRKKKRVGTSK